MHIKSHTKVRGFKLKRTKSEGDIHVKMTNFCIEEHIHVIIGERTKLERHEMGSSIVFHELMNSLIIQCIY